MLLTSYMEDPTTHIRNRDEASTVGRRGRGARRRHFRVVAEERRRVRQGRHVLLRLVVRLPPRDAIQQTLLLTYQNGGSLI